MRATAVLAGVQPPQGPGWTYKYASGLVGELTRLTAPGGSWLSYGYGDATRRAGPLTMLTRVVTSR